MSEENQDYSIKTEPKKAGMSTGAKLGIGALVLGGAALAIVPIVRDQQSAPDVVASDSSSFEGSTTTSGGVSSGLEGLTSDEGGIDFSAIENQLSASQTAAEEERLRLQAQIADLQSQLSSQGNEELAAFQTQLAEVAAANEQALADLSAQLTQQLADAEATYQQDQLARDERENQLIRENDALAAELSRLQGQSQSVEDQLAAEQQRKLEEQQRALMEARIRSNPTIFDAGGNTTGGGPEESASSTTFDSSGRAFVEGATAAVSQQAQLITDPSRTVLQGTMINATLETAIDSSQPGVLTAMVNESVYSFDGANVLMPPGTRLFGRYSSDISLGQRRVLVAFDRAVTPEGQSVDLAAYGGDGQGRSGLSGDVNTRFGERFGSAFLLSVITAGASTAVADATDEISEEAAEDIADGFIDAISPVIGELARLEPIITVAPGSPLTVIVDRDLEFFL